MDEFFFACNSAEAALGSSCGAIDSECSVRIIEIEEIQCSFLEFSLAILLLQIWFKP